MKMDGALGCMNDLDSSPLLENPFYNVDEFYTILLYEGWGLSHGNYLFGKIDRS